MVVVFYNAFKKFKYFGLFSIVKKNSYVIWELDIIWISGMYIS